VDVQAIGSQSASVRGQAFLTRIARRLGKARQQEHGRRRLVDETDVERVSVADGNAASCWCDLGARRQQRARGRGGLHRGLGCVVRPAGCTRDSQQKDDALHVARGTTLAQGGRVGSASSVGNYHHGTRTLPPSRQDFP